MRLVFYSLLLLLTGAGCVSKAKYEAKVREAYLEGQRQAQAEQKSQSKTVTVRGNVKKETIPWTEGMTVAKAIVEAEYLGLADPRRIIVIHNNEATELKPSDLFQGKDPLLEPGDTVVVKLY